MWLCVCVCACAWSHGVGMRVRLYMYIILLWSILTRRVVVSMLVENIELSFYITTYVYEYRENIEHYVHTRTHTCKQASKHARIHAIQPITISSGIWLEPEDSRNANKNNHSNSNADCVYRAYPRSAACVPKICLKAFTIRRPHNWQMIFCI